MILRKTLLAFGVLLAPVIGYGVDPDPKTFTLAYADVEFFPFEMGNKETPLEPPGIAVDIITTAVKELGLKPEVRRFPNNRVLAELEGGTVDGACSFSFKEERLKSGKYPMKDGKADSARRLTTVSYYVYKLRTSSLEWDGKEFKNLKGWLGGSTGYSIVDDLKKKGIKMEEAKTTEQNLKKLVAKKIDGFAAQDVTTDFYVERPEYAMVTRLPTPLATKDYYLMLSNKFVTANPDLAEKIWSKIGEIRDRVTKESAPKYKEPG